MKNEKHLSSGFKKLALVVAAVGSSFGALANDGPYIGIEGGGNRQAKQEADQFSDSLFDTKFKTGFIAGLVAGYSLNNGFRPELEIDIRRNQVSSVNQRGVTFAASGKNEAVTGFGNLWYDIKTDTGLFHYFHPYIGGGIGGARVALRHTNFGGVSQPNSLDTLFAYQGGAGVGVDITQNLTASLDYRHMKTEEGTFKTSAGNVKESYRNQSLMAGLRYSFGRPAPVPVALPAPVPEPMPAPAPAPVAPPVDSDGDGVPDYLDKCPNTPHGFKVDATGCIIQQSVILRGINFVYNKSELTEPAKDTLNEVAAGMVGQPDLLVQIAGHTDSVGSAAYNLKLSQSRANSVRAYLISKGVAAANLEAKGFGLATPIASNKTEEGRAQNRRVEFVVVSTPVNVKVQTSDSTEKSKEAAESGEPAKVKKAMKKKK